jgi:hypothetical protein
LEGQVLSGKEGIPRLRPEDTVRRRALLGRLHVTADRMAARVPVGRLRQWVEEGTHHGLSLPDARMVAEVKASAQARGIGQPVLLTLDEGGTLLAMRRRGVNAVGFSARPIRTTPVTPTHAQPLPGIRVPPPKSRGLAIKIGGTLALVGLTALLTLIFGDPVQKQNDRRLAEAFAKLATEMDKWVAGNVRMVIDEVVDSGNAYVVAELEISSVSGWAPGTSGEAGHWDAPMLAYDSVRISSLYISSRSIEKTGNPRAHTQNLATSKIETYDATVSSRIPALPEDQVNYYRMMTNLIKATHVMLRTSPGLSAANRHEIRQGIEIMEKEIDERFPFNKFKPSDPELWTQEGYALYSK